MNLNGKNFGLRRPLAGGMREQRPALQNAFTLIELIIVMTLLLVVISVAAPSLAGFFRGRAVEAEARRLLSLTRLGQSRAVSAGVPVILWVDTTQREYGLEEDASYNLEDKKAVQYTLDGNVTVEIGANEAAQSAITANTLFGSMQSASKHATLPQIRFLPDGSIDESSRENFRLMDREGGSLWLTLSTNRLNYEIRNEPVRR